MYFRDDKFEIYARNLSKKTICTICNTCDFWVELRFWRMMGNEDRNVYQQLQIGEQRLRSHKQNHHRRMHFLRTSSSSCDFLNSLNAVSLNSWSVYPHVPRFLQHNNKPLTVLYTHHFNNINNFVENRRIEYALFEKVFDIDYLNTVQSNL